MVEEIKTGDFVIPGDFLATAEEFVPGDGAYEEEGNIYSSCTGVVLVDIRTKRMSVFSKTPMPPAMKRGDTVIARIDEVREQLARVDIGVLKGYEDRQLPLPDAGTIHVSQVRDSYVKDLLNEFKAGDVVRAKVLNAQRSPIQLSTVGDDLGVIVAFCSKCKAPLDIDGSKLKCPECGNVEFRKIASNYRRGVL